MEKEERKKLLEEWYNLSLELFGYEKDTKERFNYELDKIGFLLLN
jgi:hypothetical protein